MFYVNKHVRIYSEDFFLILDTDGDSNLSDSRKFKWETELVSVFNVALH